MINKNEIIIVEKNIEFSKETVWNAITQIDQMKQWFFEQIESFEPIVGFKTSFDVKSGVRIFRHIWKISEVIPQNIIVYSWKYEGYEGDSFVTFELQLNNSETNLKIINKIVEDFSADIPEFQRDSCVAGWEYFLDRLNSYLQSVSDI